MSVECLGERWELWAYLCGLGGSPTESLDRSVVQWLKQETGWASCVIWILVRTYWRPHSSFAQGNQMSRCHSDSLDIWEFFYMGTYHPHSLSRFPCLLSDHPSFTLWKMLNKNILSFTNHLSRLHRIFTSDASCIYSNSKVCARKWGGRDYFQFHDCSFLFYCRPPGTTLVLKRDVPWKQSTVLLFQERWQC